MISVLNLLQQSNGNKMKYITIILTTLLLLPHTILLSQTSGPDTVKTINNKKYYIHIVKKGENINHITNLYNIEKDALIKLNPELKKGIQPKQVLKIPVTDKNNYLLKTIQKKQKIEKDTNTVKENETNNSYIIHIVTKGETVYSISKKYNVTQQDIINLNPELKSTNLKISQKIRIPNNQQSTIKSNINDSNISQINKQKTKKTPINDNDSSNLSMPDEYIEETHIIKKDILTPIVIEHKVTKKETLYSISNKYNVTVDDIMFLNPQLINGLKEGMLLNIKLNKFDSTRKDSTLEKIKIIIHYISNKESYYSLSKKYNVDIDEIKKLNPNLNEILKPGQIIKIPVKSNSINYSETIKPSDKDKPFVNKKNKDVFIETNLINTSIIPDTINIEKNNTKKEMQKKQLYNSCLLIPIYTKEFKENIPEEDAKYFDFITFYEGFLLGIDSIAKTDIKLNLFVYDVTNDTNDIKNIINDKDIKNADLIIGPFFNNNLIRLVKNLKQSQTKIVSPFATDDNVLSLNQNVIKLSLSTSKEYKYLCNYIINNYSNSNIFIINDGSEKHIKMSKNIYEIIDNLKDSNSNISINQPISINNISKINDLIDIHKENIFISLLKGEAEINNYLRILNNMSDKYNISIYGMKEWSDIENIDYNYLNNIKFYLFSPFFIDYQSEKVISFIEAYRQKYYTDPNIYSFIGYDLCRYFLEILYKYGINFQYYFDKNDLYNPLYTNFVITKKESNGWENNYINIYKYDNYKLKKVN